MDFLCLNWHRLSFDRVYLRNAHNSTSKESFDSFISSFHHFSSVVLSNSNFMHKWIVDVFNSFSVASALFAAFLLSDTFFSHFAILRPFCLNYLNDLELFEIIVRAAACRHRRVVVYCIRSIRNQKSIVLMIDVIFAFFSFGWLILISECHWILSSTWL